MSKNKNDPDDEIGKGYYLSPNLLLRNKIALMKEDSGFAEQRDFISLMHQASIILASETASYISTHISHNLFNFIDSSIYYRNISIVGILRSSLNMLEAFKAVYGVTQVGFIGLYSHTKEKFPDVHDYLISIPDSDSEIFILIDPVIARGTTAIRALEILDESGVDQDKIVFSSFLATKEGINKILDRFPKTNIIVGDDTAKINDSRSRMENGFGGVSKRLYRI